MSRFHEPDDNRDHGDMRRHEPWYYAPSPWRERLRPLSSPMTFPSSTRSTDEVSPPAQDTADVADSLDAELERAVYEALRRPREPAAIAGAANGFLHGLDRRIALFSVAGRVAAAISISALVALIFVLTIPVSHDEAGPAENVSSGIAEATKAAVSQPAAANDDAKPGLCELQSILGAPETQPAITSEQSETLLQRFMQWRQSPSVARTP